MQKRILMVQINGEIFKEKKGPKSVFGVATTRGNISAAIRRGMESNRF